jgi:hypothetical protein
MLYNDRECVGVDWSTETSLKDNPDPSLKRKGRIMWEDTSAAVRCGNGSCTKCNCTQFREKAANVCDCTHSYNDHRA